MDHKEELVATSQGQGKEQLKSNGMEERDANGHAGDENSVSPAVQHHAEMAAEAKFGSPAARKDLLMTRSDHALPDRPSLEIQPPPRAADITPEKRPYEAGQGKTQAQSPQIAPGIVDTPRRRLLATASAPVRLDVVDCLPAIQDYAPADRDDSEGSPRESPKTGVQTLHVQTHEATCNAGDSSPLNRTKSMPSTPQTEDQNAYQRSATQSGGRNHRPKHKENANVRLAAGPEKMSDRKKKKLMKDFATIQKDGTVEFDVGAGSTGLATNLFGPGIFDEGGEVGEEEPFDEDLEKEARDVPPMQVVMLIVGTRGDVQPFIAIGKRLQEYGHRVRLATHTNFREFVMSSGLEFYPIGGDPKILAGYMVKNKGFLPSGPGEIQIQRKQIKGIINSLLPACIAPDLESGSSVAFRAQAIIANPPAYGHVHVAEFLRVPLHIFFTMPWTTTSQFPHPLSRVTSPAGYRMSYQVVDSLIWWGIRGMINDFRKKKLKLRPINYLSGSQGSIAELPTGYIWSPHLVPKPRDWGPLVDVCGFCFLDLARDYKPPNDLLQWLKAGPAPVYIGFGSLPVVDPKGMTDIIMKAFEATHVRGIIFKGWGGMGDLKEVPEHVFLIEDCPHDWLFKQCAAVVHHGGAGTTAAGLKAACPTTVVPFFGDQPFWGERIHGKGVGPPPIPVDQFSLDKLVNAIKFMLNDEVKQRATDLAHAMEKEDGVEGAVLAFHKHLPQDTPQPAHEYHNDKVKSRILRPLRNVYSCFVPEPEMTSADS